MVPCSTECLEGRGSRRSRCKILRSRGPGGARIAPEDHRAPVRGSINVVVPDKVTKPCMRIGETPRMRGPNQEQVSARLDAITYAWFVARVATRLSECSVHSSRGGVTHIGE